MNVCELSCLGKGSIEMHVHICIHTQIYSYVTNKFCLKTEKNLAFYALNFLSEIFDELQQFQKKIK